MPVRVRILLLLCTGWCLLYELRALGVPSIPVGDTKSIHLIVLAVGSLLCLARAFGAKGERAAWTLIGLAFASWTAGEVYFTQVLWDATQPPVPSWADAGYLGLPPLLFAGLVLLLRARIGGLPRTMWVDGITAALAAGALSAAIVVQAVLSTVGGGGLADATNLAYPMTDLVLLGLIAGGVAASGRRLDRTFGLLAAAVLSFCVADSVYLVRVAEGTWASGGPIEPGWWAAPLLLAAAAWSPRGERVARRTAGTGVIAMPIAFATLGLSVLVAGSIGNLNALAIVLATASLGAVMLRLMLTFQQNSAMLAESRHEALTDSLTGLGNRRHLLADLDAAYASPVRPRVLLAFDLNGFKAYNDGFGHAAGDQLLARLGRALEDAVGNAGRAYRLGGDEFCVLTEGAAFETLREATLSALSEDGQGFAISAAHGSAQIPAEATDPSQALALADQRMYASKGGSRASAVAQLRDVLVAVLDERAPALSDHGAEVARLAHEVGRRLGLEGESLDELTRAAELHDIGKSAIPDAILSKPGPLTEEEWRFIRQHTLIGERILARAPALRPVAALVRASHEHVDGSGYPEGLVADEIPIGARIIAVCDAFDALVSDRPYRTARSTQDAIAELRRCAGTQFDRRVVDAFCDVVATSALASSTQSRSNPR